MKYTESTLEESALEWFRKLGFQAVFGPDIAPDGRNPERDSYSQVVLESRLKSAFGRLNANIPVSAREEAISRVISIPNFNPKLEINNKAFHQMIRDGIDIEYKTKEGSIKGDKVWLIDKENLENNDWLVVNQFTVIESASERTGNNRRPDVVIFLNGLPLAVFELKNPTDEKTTIQQAYSQLQTYKTDIPSLFSYNELSVISDGHNAHLGTITSPIEWFMKWRTVDGKEIAPLSQNELKILINGVFGKKRFLDLISNFIVFEQDKKDISKKVTIYHQYYAVNKALRKTIKASQKKGNKKAGVIWHTQGSGKSLTMAFYAGKIIQELNNPTLVVITDRNDLDDQLFGTFSKTKDLFRQIPQQVVDRNDLKTKLKVASGGIVFTTIQKFLPSENRKEFPLLSERENIVVIADEAHRSHYGFKAKINKRQGLSYGFAKYIRDALPNASFIGFTATPIALRDRNTTAIFGDVIDIYDVTRSVEDKATVPIYYEARLAKINLLESEKPKIDRDFEEITEGEEINRKEKLKSKWARLEAMVGAEKRLKLIAEDIVEHFDNRLSVIDGKGMIVCMSRRICVDLYGEIIKLRPEWHSDNDKKGFLKVVMTGAASDPQHFQPHIRNKHRREQLAEKFKDPDDKFTLAIVRDMWLTGFNIPCLHTIYVDKPMKGHGLMQAIARTNRIFKDKQGGLIVDYMGMAAELREALSYYTKSDQQLTAVPQEEAVKVMKEKYEIAKDMFHYYDYLAYFTALEARKIEILTEAVDYILKLEDGAKRYKKAVMELAYAFSIAIPHIEALKIRDEVAFFQAVRVGLIKLEPTTKTGPTDEDYNQAIKQIVSKAIVSDKVIDIFASIGLKKPNIEILSDEFLAEVEGLEHKNIAFEILKKLLNDEIKTMERSYLVKARSFKEMLEKTLLKYQNRTIESAQVIAELIELAKKIKKEQERGKDLGLSEDEVAFYDALATNESAIRELGDETLMKMARELVQIIRKNTTIDWTLRESIQAKLRIYIKRLLKKYDYPPDEQEIATKTVLEQAELLAKDWKGEK